MIHVWQTINIVRLYILPWMLETLFLWYVYFLSAVAELLQALAVGTLTGFGSALTGTSGPVLLLPMLFIFLWPALPALG